MTYAGSASLPLRVTSSPLVVRVTLLRWISVTLPVAVEEPHFHSTAVPTRMLMNPSEPNRTTAVSVHGHQIGA